MSINEDEYAFLSFANKNLIKNPSGGEWFKHWTHLDLNNASLKEIISSDRNKEIEGWSVENCQDGIENKDPDITTNFVIYSPELVGKIQIIDTKNLGKS